ncbi:hypothetical protein OG455_24135 [Kitasatospora sp. NBC_01287]|uniref:RNA polymerase sigma factor n=1 Tax=Kitasatospora sp. NBC_01287 TaxID=2903573 RepID=UPI002255BB0E|nr:hypothetical protein [Kitasatospora sp. NBC_01287]MCX4748568.1 hypothetical protein [Kitasatospora sp. NBC_01287]
MAGYQALYERSYDELLQQTFLLTAGHRRSAERATRRALGSAWNRWAELAEEPDPATWLRLRAFEAALAPWRPVGPRPHRTATGAAPDTAADTATTAADTATGPAPGQGAEADLALLTALRGLSRARRRVVVLHDALGLAPTAIAVEAEASTAAVSRRLHAAHVELARALPTVLGSDPAVPGFSERLGGLLYRAAVRACPADPAAPPRADRRRRAGARLQAAALPAACGLLVLGTAASITGTLAGHGPSAYFDPRPVPAPLCSTVANGSAGPARPGAAPGIRSLWCGAGKTPHPAPVNRSGVRRALPGERQPLISSRARRAVSDGVLPTLTPAASRASFFA